MDDLISRKGAINIIEDTEDCVCSYVAIALGDAINKIAKLPPSSRWVSCSERLPDMHDEVLVTARGEVSIAWLYVDGKWRSTDMPPSMFRDIVAWMPLPEPYKEVTE